MEHTQTIEALREEQNAIIMRLGSGDDVVELHKAYNKAAISIRKIECADDVRIKSASLAIKVYSDSGEEFENYTPASYERALVVNALRSVNAENVLRDLRKGLVKQEDIVFHVQYIGDVGVTHADVWATSADHCGILFTADKRRLRW